MAEWWEESYIYIARTGDTYYKVGRSQNPKARVKEMQVGCPLEISLEFVAGPMTHDHAVGLERMVLADLEEFVVRGEWHTLGADVLEDTKDSLADYVEDLQCRYSSSGAPVFEARCD